MTEYIWTYSARRGHEIHSVDCGDLSGRRVGPVEADSVEDAARLVRDTRWAGAGDRVPVVIAACIATSDELEPHSTDEPDDTSPIRLDDAIRELAKEWEQEAQQAETSAEFHGGVKAQHMKTRAEQLRQDAKRMRALVDPPVREYTLTLRTSDPDLAGRVQDAVHHSVGVYGEDGTFRRRVAAQMRDEYGKVLWQTGWEEA